MSKHWRLIMKKGISKDYILLHYVKDLPQYRKFKIIPKKIIRRVLHE